jgi:TDG/mug DNA glycosylase family protein
MQPFFKKPSKEEVAAAVGKKVPDVIAPRLRILFCGINPGLYSAAVGHHFARPGNRFWRGLKEAELTDRLLSPYEEAELLRVGIGITNLVGRATATADQISTGELKRGRRRLEEKIRKYRPRIVAILGMGAYRKASGSKKVETGAQEAKIGTASLWVLPNPSGLNAHYQLSDYARLFRELKQAS